MLLKDTGHLLSAKESDTIVTKVFTGLPARLLRNRFLDEYTKAKVEYLDWPLPRSITENIYFNTQAKNNIDFYTLFSGQGLRMLKGGQSAEEIVKEIMNEVKEQVKTLCNTWNNDYS